MLYFRLRFVTLRHEANAKYLHKIGWGCIRTIPLDNFPISTYLISKE